MNVSILVCTPGLCGIVDIGHIDEYQARPARASPWHCSDGNDMLAGLGNNYVMRSSDRQAGESRCIGIREDLGFSGKSIFPQFEQLFRLQHTHASAEGDVKANLAQIEDLDSMAPRL